MALRRIVRNRPSLSCWACRRRKIKCEKQRPACVNCVRLGDECVYESEAEHREKAAAKKRKVLEEQEERQQHQPQHQALDPPDAHDAHDARAPHGPHDAHYGDHGPPATDAELEAAVGWTTPPSSGPGLQWDAPTLDFDLDFDVHFDFGLMTPGFSLKSFQLEPACGLDALPNRRDTPPRPGSPFEGYISTQDDGSKLFIERTFWALVSRDASAPLCPLCYAG
jgi:hypothetical protein